MTLRSAQTTVDTTAGGTRIDGTSGSGAFVLIKNQGTIAVYVGPSGLTTSTGFKLDAGESLSLDSIRGDDALYGITGSSSTTVHVLQAGV